MKRWIKIGLLIISHVWLALLIFTGHNAVLTKLENDRAAADPLYRTSVRLNAAAPESAQDWPSLEQDLAELRGRLGATGVDTLRLISAIRSERAGEASAICQRLGWQRCDSAALDEMRKLVKP
jgi:hypothetical protein